MAKQIFINLAVRDLQKSLDFYAALGFDTYKVELGQKNTELQAQNWEMLPTIPTVLCMQGRMIKLQLFVYGKTGSIPSR